MLAKRDVLSAQLVRLFCVLEGSPPCALVLQGACMRADDLLDCASGELISDCALVCVRVCVYLYVCLCVCVSHRLASLLPILEKVVSHAQRPLTSCVCVYVCMYLTGWPLCCLS